MLIEQAIAATIVNYNRNTFIVQATIESNEIENI
jgi:hypothetical protein